MRCRSGVRPVLLAVSAAALILGTLGCGSSAGPFDGTTGPAGTSPGTTGPGPTGPALPAFGPPIEQLTPEQGVGAYPRFEWSAVSGAVRYTLFVFDAGGVAFWAWDGTATAVYLGGLDQPPTPGNMGPALDGPMSWLVMAFDTAGNLIASSGARPIAP